MTSFQHLPLEALAEELGISDETLFYIVKDQATTPQSRKIAAENLRAYFSLEFPNLASLSVIDVNADQVAVFDNDTGETRKVSVAALATAAAGGITSSAGLAYDGAVVDNYTPTASPGINSQLEGIDDRLSGIASNSIAIANNANNNAANAAAIALNSSKRSYPVVDENKLAAIENNATGDQTAPEIIALIDAQIGTGWQNDNDTQLSQEQVEDMIGTLLLAGTHSGITVNYDDINNKIDLTVTAAGGGVSLTQEDVEDITGALLNANTTGVTVTYNDAANTLNIGLVGEIFTTAEKTKLGTLSNRVEGYADLASFPATGAIERIYIARDTNIIYRWDSTTYVQLGGSGTSFTTLAQLNALLTDADLIDDRYVTKQDLTFAANTTWDGALGHEGVLTLTGNTTIDPIVNLVDGGYSLIIEQDATGGHSVTFDPSYNFLGVAPFVNTAPNSVSIFYFLAEDTNVYAQSPQDPGAGEANVQADWNESDTNSDAHILNKPNTITALEQAAITANTLALADKVDTRYVNQQLITTGTSHAWDMSLGHNLTILLTGNGTLQVPTNMITGSTVVLTILQNTGGGNTLTLPANFIFPDGQVFNPNTGASEATVVTGVVVGTNILSSTLNYPSY